MLFFAIGFAEVDINKSNFPDEGFRNYIIDLGIDLNHDNVLQDEEIESVKNLGSSLGCDGQTNNVNGIEYFYALEELEFTNIPVRSMDFSCFPNLCKLTITAGKRSPVINELDLTNNTKLEQITVQKIPTTKIYLPKTNSLQKLMLEGLGIQDIDLTNSPCLREVIIQDCKLKELDVTQNPEIYILQCDNNRIQNIKLSNNKKLAVFTCSCNLLQNLDLTQCTQLKTLQADNNRIRFLDMRNSGSIEYISYEGNAGISIIRETEQMKLSVFSENDAKSIVAGNTLRFTAKFVFPETVMKNDAVKWAVKDFTTNLIPDYAKISEQGVLTVSKNVEERKELEVSAKSEVFGTIDSVRLTVVPSIDKITLDHSEIILYLGSEELYTVSMKIEPADASLDEIMWKMDRQNIIEIKDRKDGSAVLTPLTPGKVKVTVYEPKGKKANVEVIVKEPVTGLNLIVEDIVFPGGSTTIIPGISPDNASDTKLRWSLDVDDSIAVINKTGRLQINPRAEIGTIINVTCEALGAPSTLVSNLKLEVSNPPRKGIRKVEEKKIPYKEYTLISHGYLEDAHIRFISSNWADSYAEIETPTGEKEATQSITVNLISGDEALKNLVSVIDSTKMVVIQRSVNSNLRGEAYFSVRLESEHWYRFFTMRVRVVPFMQSPLANTPNEFKIQIKPGESFSLMDYEDLFKCGNVVYSPIIPSSFHADGITYKEKKISVNGTTIWGNNPRTFTVVQNGIHKIMIDFEPLIDGCQTNIIRRMPLFIEAQEHVVIGPERVSRGKTAQYSFSDENISVTWKVEGEGVHIDQSGLMTVSEDAFLHSKFRIIAIPENGDMEITLNGQIVSDTIFSEALFSTKVQKGAFKIALPQADPSLLRESPEGKHYHRYIGAGWEWSCIESEPYATGETGSDFLFNTGVEYYAKIYYEVFNSIKSLEDMDSARSAYSIILGKLNAAESREIMINEHPAMLIILNNAGVILYGRKSQLLQITLMNQKEGEDLFLGDIGKALRKLYQFTMNDLMELADHIE